MRIKKLLPLLFSIFLLAGGKTFSQETNENRPLIEIINELQDRFEVQFNYAPNTVAGIQLPAPDPDSSLDECLTYLRKETGLQFNRLSGRIITIVRPRNTICGFLRDYSTRNPVVFATIQAGATTVLTDETGFFQLSEVSEDELITIRHVAYMIFEQPAGNFQTDSCGDIFLTPDEQQLAEVVLYEYLTRGIDKINNGSFTIDFNQFQILPGLIENDVLQSVQAFPGIQSINETVSNINIRGGSHDQNLIVWDDIKMYQSGHFFGLISMYNPQITQRVSLRKNGSPAALTDGVSGTIAMETAPEINTEFSGNIAINFIDASGYADIPLGSKSSIQIAARKSISDLWETPTYSEYFNRISQETEVRDNVAEVNNSDIEFDFYDTSLRWLYAPSDKDEIQLNFILAQNELVFNENAELNNEPVSRQSNLEQGSIAGGFQYRRYWSNKFKTVLKIYNTDYQLKAINANILNDQRFLQENKVSETGILLDTGYKISDNVEWFNGYQFIETKVSNLDDVDNPVFRRLDGEVLRIHSIFSSIGFSNTANKTNLNLGGRLNYLEKFNKIIFEPRLSLNHRISDGFHLELLGELKNQNTSQVINFQNDFLGIEKRRWQLSNDQDVPVLESKQASLGLSYARNGWLLNGVAYYKEVTGITAQSQGFQDQYEFVKTAGAYEAAGIDLLIRKQIRKINTWFSYTYLSSRYRFPELRADAFTSNFDIPHSLTFGLTYAAGPLQISGGFNWRSGKPFTTPNQEEPLSDGDINFEEVNNDRLESYSRTDISGIYEFGLGRNSKGQVGLSVWNLFDRENPINTYYRIRPGGELEQIVETSLGITPNAVLRFYF